MGFLVIVIILVLTLVVALNFQKIQTYLSPTENISFGSQQVVIAESPQTTPRWNHLMLTVYIDNYKDAYTNDFISAMDIWESAIDNLITFSQTTDTSADIAASWVSNFASSSKEVTGDTRIRYIDTGSYELITSAQIQILRSYAGGQFDDTDMTNIAMHELGHVLGLEHSNSTNDVMYPVLEIPSKRLMQISPSYSEFLHQVYQTQPNPDLSFYRNVNATKFSEKSILRESFYFNVSFAVKNVGLSDSPATSVSVFTDENFIIDQAIPSLEPGTYYQISLGNIASKSDFSYIKLVIDRNDLIDEINKTNNALVVTVG